MRRVGEDYRVRVWDISRGRDVTPEALGKLPKSTRAGSGTYPDGTRTTEASWVGFDTPIFAWAIATCYRCRSGPDQGSKILTDAGSIYILTAPLLKPAAPRWPHVTFLMVGTM